METGKELVIDNHYVMSAADICTIDFLDKILASGIQVLKIEGRGRSPEYVSTVVRAYRNALHDIENGTYTPERIVQYYDQLKKVFNRGLSKGNYYLGKEIGAYSDSYGSKATEEKVYVGRVSHYYPRPSVAQIHIESDRLSEGDEVYIIGATTGVLRAEIKELRDEDESRISTAKKSQYVTITVPSRVRINDAVYRIRQRESIDSTS